MYAIWWIDRKGIPRLSVTRYPKATLDLIESLNLAANLPKQIYRTVDW